MLTGQRQQHNRKVKEKGKLVFCVKHKNETNHVISTNETITHKHNQRHKMYPGPKSSDGSESQVAIALNVENWCEQSRSYFHGWRTCSVGFGCRLNLRISLK